LGIRDKGLKTVRVGISSCLLGDEVRYDGSHKRDRFLTDVLGPHVEWVRVCPEVELGLGVPRETLRLVRVDGDVRMITTRTAIDHTDAMRGWARRRTDALASMNLRGYVLKKNSPSCGMAPVKVCEGDGPPTLDGVGLFAEILMRRFPLLPVEDEGRLQDPVLRENFVERIFAYQRLCDLFVPRWRYAALIEFHARNKLWLLAHSPAAYRDLGRLVATGRQRSRVEVRRRYEQQFMAALSKPATRSRHTNVLMHIAGYLKKQLDRRSKSELLSSINEYHAGTAPLTVPLTLLRRHVRFFGIEYLMGQAYLEPHASELVLGSHA
jgi:uncharacterized protein YbgA (DUF1722 family)/uncharacterized protein YbbK (DUF523 family)